MSSVVARLQLGSVELSCESAPWFDHAELKSEALIIPDGSLTIMDPE